MRHALNAWTIGCYGSSRSQKHRNARHFSGRHAVSDNMSRDRRMRGSGSLLTFASPMDTNVHL
jgi:hypothetical protein